MRLLKRICAFLIISAIIFALFVCSVSADNKHLGAYGSWSGWTDIRKLYCYYGYNGNVLLGLKKDGAVIGCLLSEEDTSLHEELQEVLSWTDIDSLYFKNGAVIGLKNNGTVILNSASAQQCIYDADSLKNVTAIFDVYNSLYLLHNDGTVSALSSSFAGDAETGFEGIRDIKFLYTSTWGDAVAATEDGKIVWPKSSKYNYDQQNSITENWKDVEKVFRTDNSVISLVAARKSDGSTSCRSYQYKDHLLSGRMPFLEKVIESWQGINDYWSEFYRYDLNVLLDDGTLKGVITTGSCELDETDNTLSGCEKFHIVDYCKMNLTNVSDGNIILDTGEIYPYSRGDSCGYLEKYKYNGKERIIDAVTPWGNELGLTEKGTVVKIDPIWYQNLWDPDTDGKYTNHVISEDLTGRKVKSDECVPGQLWWFPFTNQDYTFEFKDGGPHVSASGFRYLLLEDNGAFIDGYEGDKAEGYLPIPNEIDGHPVVYISGIDCSRYNILIPDTVTAVNLIFGPDSVARVAIPSSVKGYEGHYDGCQFPEIGYYDLDRPNRNVPEFFGYGKEGSIQLPKEESYLPAFEKMTVKISSANVYDYETSGKQVRTASVAKGTEVYALARQSIMTFVLYKDVEQQIHGGWITSENLASAEKTNSLHGLFFADTAV